jgi:hypothetical protein
LVLALACAFTSLLLCQGVSNVYGQATINASLSGSILDSSGAAVPGAALTLTDPTKGFTRTQTSSNDGHYSFTLVPVGTYNLRVEKSGFRRYDQIGIILGVGQDVTQDVTLQVGTVTQEIRVTGAASMLDTTNANIETSVSAKEAVELPLNWRTPFALVTLDSSVSNSVQNQALYNGISASLTAEQDASFFNIGGGRQGTTAFLLDGHWNTTADWDSLLYSPSVDEVQEFKMQTYAFTAQYGLSAGNVINVITKSGTDHFHGDVFEFLRNDAMDANNFMNNAYGLTKPSYRRNQFGVSAGGPVYIPWLYPHKDKTFIFGIYEGLRQPAALSAIVNVPTTAMKGGDFSALLGSTAGSDVLGRPIYNGAIYDPFTTRQVTAGVVDPTTGLTPTASGYVRDPFGAGAGNSWVPTNIIPPGRFDTVAKNMLQYYPAPTNGNLTNNFTAALTTPATTDRFSVRVDQNISDKSRLFVRYSKEWISVFTTGDIFGANDVGGPGSTSDDNRYDIGFGYTHVFSPTTVVSYTFGVNYWDETYLPQGYGFKPSTLGLPSSLDTSPMFPTLTIDGTFGLGGGNQNATPREVVTNAFDLTHVHGAHTLNMGFMNILNYTYSDFTYPLYANFGRGMTNGPDPLAGGESTGYGFASFLLGAGGGGGGVASVSGTANSFTQAAEAAFMKKYYGFYFQDDWKVTHKLSAGLGVHYDIQTPTTDRFDRLATFEPNGINPISSAVGFSVPGYLQYVGSPNSRGLYQAQYSNLAPRVSLTYKLTNKLVMRTGFGMFYTNAMENGDYQGLTLYGFTQVTPWVGSVDGITPTNLLSNPFPNGLLQPLGKSQGKLTQVGQAVNAVYPTRKTPYVQQWTMGFQYALTSNDNLDVTYVGNHAVHLSWDTINASELTTASLALGSGLQDQVTNPFYGQITSSGCGLDQPTVVRSQLLSPYPEFCGVSDIEDNSASSHYNSLMINYRHRWSQGLHMLVSFTTSKYIDQSAGAEGWVNPNGIGIQNSYNLAAERSLDANDIPKSLVVSYVYELPFGRGKKFGNDMNKVVNGVAGGWQFSGITSLKSGFPLGIWDTFNNAYSGGAQRPNIVGNPHISNPSVNEWFNTAAFAQPASYTYGDASRTMPNLRSPGYNNWDLTLEKSWNWGEKLRIQYRAELYNAFNTTWLHAPDANYGDATFGQITVAGYARQIQMGMKIYW